MAEGWARALMPDGVRFYSAGIETHGLNPNAVQVMREAGVDLSGHRSQNLEDLGEVEFDLVITVCGHAHENCPVFPGNAEVRHVPFDDPPRLAACETDPERVLDHYRRVRDEIRDYVVSLKAELNSAR